MIRTVILRTILETVNCGLSVEAEIKSGTSGLYFRNSEYGSLSTCSGLQRHLCQVTVQDYPIHYLDVLERSTRQYEIVLRNRMTKYSSLQIDGQVFFPKIHPELRC